MQPTSLRLSSSYLSAAFEVYTGGLSLDVTVALLFGISSTRFFLLFFPQHAWAHELKNIVFPHPDLFLDLSLPCM